MLSRLSAVFISLSLFFSSFFFVVYISPESIFPFVQSTSANASPNQSEQQEIIYSLKDAYYGNDVRQSLDFSFPKCGQEKVGLLLYIHGGGWTRGKKESTQKVKAVLNPNDKYAVASMNYRYAEKGAVDSYNIIEDITAALTYIKNTAKSYGVEIDRVILSGYSAGGHLSLLYAYRYAAVSPLKVTGVFAFSPVSDFTDDEFYTKNTMGNEKNICEMVSKVVGAEITPKNRVASKELLLELSPISYIDSDCVPTMIFHGEKDNVAPYGESVRLYEKLKENGAYCELITFTNSGHALDKDEDCLKLTDEMMKEFIETSFEIK